MASATLCRAARFRALWFEAADYRRTRLLTRSGDACRSANSRGCHSRCRGQVLSPPGLHAPEGPRFCEHDLSMSLATTCESVTLTMRSTACCGHAACLVYSEISHASCVMYSYDDRMWE